MRFDRWPVRQSAAAAGRWGARPWALGAMWAMWAMWGLCFGLTLVASPARADALSQIRARGEVVVGVKKDVPLWGQLDEKSGRIVGLEPDLAQQLADQLGVRLKLVGVLTSERIDAVRQGRVDVLIATLSDTAQRREQLTLVEPHYYASGVNLLARKAEGLRQWAQLRNRRVCGRRGAFYNRPITVTYGADVIALYSNALALQALRDGRCVALLHDDTSIAATLQQSEWARDYEMPLSTLHVVPWAIALAPAERGGALERQISDLVVRWHRSGELARLEARWGIPASVFVRQMQLRWAEGGVCGVRLSQQTPEECR